MEKKKSKKKFNLDDAVAVEGIEPIVAPTASIKIPISSGKVNFTLSVPEEFVPEFKSWCIKHKTTCSNALVDSFALLKQKHGY